MTTRRTLTPAMKTRIWEREKGACYLCGEPILPCHRVEYEHPHAIGLGGPDEESEIRLAHTVPCHRDKTRRDRWKMAKADRQGKFHRGEKPRKYNWPSRPLTDPNWKRRFDGTVVRRDG